MRSMYWERRHWIDLANFKVWQLLKIIDNQPSNIRNILNMYAGSPNAAYSCLKMMERYGLVKTWRTKKRGVGRERFVSITRRGKKLLRIYNEIGEIVHSIRRGSSKETFK